LYDGEKENCQSFMVNERRCFAQKTFPEQSYGQDSCKAGTVTRYGKEKGIQNGSQEDKEISQVPWPIIVVVVVGS
jgi:hypothetical protein